VSALLVALRVGLGALLLYAAATKIPDVAAFAESVANYRLLPPALVPGVAAAVIGVELVAGALLVVGRYTRAAALVASVLLAVFTAGLAQALLRGIDLRCGCFGGEEPATWLTVLRDVAMLAAAIAVFVGAPRAVLGRRRVAGVGRAAVPRGG
jgi:putative oxidoreductase